MFTSEVKIHNYFFLMNLSLKYQECFSGINTALTGEYVQAVYLSGYEHSKTMFHFIQVKVVVLVNIQSIAQLF
jgi:hypothetical protein